METVDQSVIASETERARQITADVELPPEVSSLSLRSGLDLYGQPALWVDVNVKKEVEADREVVKRLTQFGRDVQSRIIDGGVTLFPFTTLEQAA